MSSRGRPLKLAGQEENVIAMYLSGATLTDLMEHFDCSDTPLTRILDAAGIERRRGRPPGRGTTNGPRIKSSPKSGDENIHPGQLDMFYQEPSEEPKSERAPRQTHIPSIGPRASRPVMDEVFRRDGFRCRLCGASTRLMVEYAISPENGGNSRNPKDLRTVCATCESNPVKLETVQTALDTVMAEDTKKGLGFLRRIFSGAEEPDDGYTPTNSGPPPTEPPPKLMSEGRNFEERYRKALIWIADNGVHESSGELPHEDCAVCVAEEAIGQ